MNKINYQKELDKVIGTLAGSERRPKLLLHSCCAPCSSYCLLYLREYFDITCYFYNPNISEVVEYFKRLSELERLVAAYNEDKSLKVPSTGENDSASSLAGEKDGILGGRITPSPIRVLDGGFDSKNFFEAVKGLENEPEGGKRCTECFSLRLEKSASAARIGEFDYFTTTLTISPLKNEQLINQLGYSIGEKYGVKWLPSDFKKKGGYQESIKLSEKYELYRQNYCGCVYSLRRDYAPSCE